MKATLVGILLGFLSIAAALPLREQLALANSLQVGRQEDPNVWACEGCDETNKPLISFVIQEKAKQIRSILSVYEEYTVLAFRYTANVQNVWQDLLWAIQVQDEGAPKGAKVQKQYDQMWNAIRNDVIGGLRNHVHTRRLIITGISLGGGLAGISFVDIKASGNFENVEVVTFGAPRVGNDKWAAWFDSITPSTRIFIQGDPVAVLPQCLTFICNYRQTGTPVVCDKTQEVCRVQSASLAQKFIFTKDSAKMLAQEILEHRNELQQGELGGVLDHIYGYKKIYKYVLIQ